MMRKILKPCINKYVLTNNVLQEACDTAKGDLFGKPNDNNKYAYAIKEAIQEMGHTVDLISTNRRQTMKTVNAIVLKEEMDKKKAAKESMTRQEKVNYVNNWKKGNDIFLCDAFRLGDGPQYHFFDRYLHLTIHIQETSSLSAGSLTGRHCPHELWEIHTIFSVWYQCKWNYVSIRICLVVWQ